MKENNFRKVLFTLLFGASLCAFIFINSSDNSNNTMVQNSQIQIDSTNEEDYYSLDVEILKHLIEQGKESIPMINSGSSNSSIE